MAFLDLEVWDLWLSNVLPIGEDILIFFSMIVPFFPHLVLTAVYDVANGSVFKVAAACNGVPYVAISNQTSGARLSMGKTTLLPLYLAAQFVLSSVVIGGVLLWELA